MDDSEIMVFVMSLALAVGGATINRTGSLHALYFRDNAGPGIVRLAVLLAMAWIGYVLWRHADPSVRGIYVVFYLVMGYGVVKGLGQAGAMAYGARTRVDAAERRNVPAALVAGAFTLATGLIFGGSVWGEADPQGEGEGGWWIPLSFFLLGWGVLVAVFGLFLLREPGKLTQRLQQERSLDDARAAAFFLLASATALTDAVAGDFWGWTHGLLTFGVLAAMLVVREALAFLPRAGERASHRLLESGAYTLMGLASWGLNRYLDRLLGAG